MKTYTTEDYKIYYGGFPSLNKKEQRWLSFPGWFKNSTIWFQGCSCLREFGGFGEEWNPHALKNCENCLGYGWPPLPWSELI